MSSQCWRERIKERGDLCEALHSAPTVWISLDPLSLSLVSNLWEVCVIYVTANTRRARPVPTPVCVLVSVCAGFCITARVCLHLVTLEPFVLFSDPDPSHLSSQISLTHTRTHTHLHTQLLWPFPRAETQSQLPTEQNLPAQQGFVFSLWVYIWLKRRTVCFKMNCRNLTPCYRIKWQLK